MQEYLHHGISTYLASCVTVMDDGILYCTVLYCLRRAAEMQSTVVQYFTSKMIDITGRSFGCLDTDPTALVVSALDNDKRLCTSPIR